MSTPSPSLAPGSRLWWRRAWRHLVGRAWAPLALAGCDQLGPGARVRGRPVVENEGGRIVIGRRFCVWSHLGRVELYAGPGATLQIGDDVFVNHGSVLSASCGVRIGDRVNIAPRCTLLDNDFHGTDERGAPPRRAPIVLEDDVWLGTGVIVLRGVTIGRGSVVAAGAVVTRDIPPGVLAGGVPARVLRPLKADAQAP